MQAQQKGTAICGSSLREGTVPTQQLHPAHPISPRSGDKREAGMGHTTPPYMSATHMFVEARSRPSEPVCCVPLESLKDEQKSANRGLSVQIKGILSERASLWRGIVTAAHSSSSARKMTSIVLTPSSLHRNRPISVFVLYPINCKGDDRKTQIEAFPLKETLFLRDNLLQAEHPLTAQHLHYHMRSREERSDDRCERSEARRNA